MADLSVSAEGQGRYSVEVRSEGVTTTHEVTVPDGFPSQLGLGPDDEARLVEESFRFLLEREPPSAILGRFELSVISRYFPEYNGEIANRLGG